MQRNTDQKFSEGNATCGNSACCRTDYTFPTMFSSNLKSLWRICLSSYDRILHQQHHRHQITLKVHNYIMDLIFALGYLTMLHLYTSYVTWNVTMIREGYEADISYLWK